MPTESSTSDILTSELTASTSGSGQLALPPAIYNVRPQDGAVCRIKIDSESEFDSYPLNEEFDFTIGENDSDIGEKLENSLCQMKQGETKDVEFVSSNTQTDTNKLNETIMVKVTLIDLANRPPIFSLSRNIKLEIATNHKVKGVELFKKDLHSFAFKRFSKAIKFLILMLPRSEIPQDLVPQFDQLLLQCYSNMAACQLKTGKYKYVVDNCTKALKLDGDNVKCLYRRAEAQLHLDEKEKCRADIIQGLKIDSRSRSLQQLLKKLEK